MSLKLQYKSNLDYQEKAINAVVDLFKGQTPKQANFTVAPPNQANLFNQSSIGIGNKLELTNEELLNNLQEVQERNGLKQSDGLGESPYVEFEVDMETGTGKTYTFIRTMMELNKKYGFKKYVIVVPSLAIKEGIYHSLQATEKHIRTLYDNEPYEYFVYDSKNLEKIYDFATSDHISIMVVNIQAFNRNINIINQDSDRFPDGRAPIDLIQETNPIVIIDEPQSAANTPTQKEAIKNLNPLCCLKYSATHIKPKNVVYRLNAVDAYNLGLVKQIEVVSFEEEDNYEDGYIRLIKTGSTKKQGIYADIEFDKKLKRKVVRTTQRIKLGSDLYELSGNRDVYQGFQVAEIDAANNIVKFTQRPETLTLDQPVGGLEEDILKQKQIESTIRAHLDKELHLNKLGIKVLSLFFIDKVENYRTYNEDGTYNKGKFALMFEETYKRIIQEDKYQELLGEDTELDRLAAEIHNGYFAQDKANQKDAKFVDTSGNTQRDDYAYELIMKDKERLLSFDTKLRFIFSHSALREGWDNPNVFQICTLNETYSEIKKRQEIGRGLRLAVNQNGERQYGFDINTLTVVANESYQVFCDTLQKEYEEDAGIQFGYIEEHAFANIIIKEAEGEYRLGSDASKEIVQSLKDNKYITKDGEALEKLQTALKNDMLELPDAYKSYKSEIMERTKRIIDGVRIQRAKEKSEVKLNKERFLSPEFKDLWDTIKYKTIYQVDFSTDDLTKACLAEIERSLSLSKRRLSQIKASVDIKEGGVVATEAESNTFELEKVSLDQLPDIVTYLQNETDLTRKTIIKILIESNTLDLFELNPQIYMQEVAQIINIVKERFIVDGIKYSKTADKDYYAQKLFEEDEVSGYLDDNLIASDKGLYDYVVYDSSVEKEFAHQLENDPNVLIYVKLPNWFKIPTPLGNYNPDWAILINDNGEQRYYFVAETKSTTILDDLRITEQKKIECGQAHFKALESNVEYVVAKDLNDVVNSVK